MNAYVAMQQVLVAARQDALRAEADTTRLLSSARPLPAVSAGGRAAGNDRLPIEQPVAVAPRSLGAAAAADRLAPIKPIAKPASPRSGTAGHGHAGCGDDSCAGSVAPAA